jgi:transposase-like protein
MGEGVHIWRQIRPATKLTRRFDQEIILCVRWYLRFKLNFRDLVEMMAERGISLAPTAIMRWI